MPDSNENLARTLTAITEVFNSPYKMAEEGAKWFISFGTLLWFIRDRLLNIPLNQDIDISLYYNSIPRDLLITRMDEYGYQLSGEVLNDVTRLPLQMSFSPRIPGLYPVDIDVFFWVLGKRYAWHTYDMDMVRKPILNKYVFKATPIEYFKASTIRYVWEEIAPELYFPSRYGSLLDTWYPPLKNPEGGYIENSGWMTRNPQYGQSKAALIKTLKTCSLIGNLE